MFQSLFGSRSGQGIDSLFQLKATGSSAKNWDFSAARPAGKKTTVLEAIAHLVKGCLGGGIVSIHEGYASCGLWGAVVLNALLGMLVYYAMTILVTSAQKAYGRTQIPTMSYPDLAEAAVAICPWPKFRKYCKCFRHIVDTIIMMDLFGACCCYQVIIARSIKQLVEGVQEVKDEGNPPIRVYIAVLWLPCILLCMITSLKYLAPFSIMANIVILLVAIATVVYGFQLAKVPLSEMPIFTNIRGVLKFTGVCVFSLGGLGVVLAIENSMAEPKKINRVLIIGMTGVVSLVMVVGFFGYWGFGKQSKSPITLNFPMNAITLFLKSAMPFMIYVTFALNFWAPFELAWFYIQKRHNPDRFWLTKRIYKALIVTVITCVAVAFPDVSVLMSVLGAFCLTNMAFIFPAFIELMLDWEDPGLGTMKWRFWKFLFLIVFGLVVMIVATTSNIGLLINTLLGNVKK